MASWRGNKIPVFLDIQLAGIVGRLRDQHVGEMFQSADTVAIGCDELNEVAFECFLLPPMRLFKAHLRNHLSQPKHTQSSSPADAFLFWMRTPRVTLAFWFAIACIPLHLDNWLQHHSLLFFLSTIWCRQLLLVLVELASWNTHIARQVHRPIHAFTTSSSYYSSDIYYTCTLQ
jgi:hypothetical protein